MTSSKENNEARLHQFYSCFKNKDYKGMQACYAEDAIFNDAVFVNLSSVQVKAMWEMLCKRGKDLKLEYYNVEADETTASAEWVATYTFSTTGKKVVNRIQAKFQLKEGLIFKHTDTFNFYTWAKQAFGITGILLGWTGFFRRKVQQKALQNLELFIGN